MLRREMSAGRRSLEGGWPAKNMGFRIHPALKTSATLKIALLKYIAFNLTAKISKLKCYSLSRAVWTPV